jgi:hypothetical protein
MKIPCTFYFTVSFIIFSPLNVYTYWAIVLDSNSSATIYMDILSGPQETKG